MGGAEGERSVGVDTPAWKWAGPFELLPGRPLRLFTSMGDCVATVFTVRDLSGFNWFVWDCNGVGGENSSEPTIAAAQREAVAAAIRWGQHR